MKVEVAINNSTAAKSGQFGIVGCDGTVTVNVSQAANTGGPIVPILPGETEIVITGSQVYLDWDVNCGAGFSHYLLERNGAVISALVPISRYTDTDVPNGTYTYDIYLINEDGSQMGYYSIEVIVTESDAVASIVPTFGDPISGTSVAYPNPVSDVLHVAKASESARISLYDVNGKPTKQAVAKDHQADISVSDLAPGLYILNVDGDVKKIMVKQ